jgi:hypothetical protein
MESIKSPYIVIGAIVSCGLYGVYRLNKNSNKHPESTNQYQNNLIHENAQPYQGGFRQRKNRKTKKRT